jgi:hypothetical protein
VWAGLIAVTFGLGALLRSAGALPVDALPPLHAHARLRIVPLLPAVAVALAGVTALPAAARRLRWPVLLAVAWVASVTWAVSLQWPDGLSRPLTAPTEYLAGLPAMGDHPLVWLHGFTAHLNEYPTHVKGHPPLPMLILWILRWTGWGGAGWAAALVIAAGASSTAAIAITVRTVVDEPTARRALPFVVLAPTAIWVATSMDALFLGVSAWTVALLAQASVREGGGSPHPPWGAIPLLSSRVVDLGDKGFHRLWITPFRVGVRASDTGTSDARTLAAHASNTNASDSNASDSNASNTNASNTNASDARTSGVRASGARASSARTLAARPIGAGARARAFARTPAFGHARAFACARAFRCVRAFAAGVLVGALPYLSYGLLTIFALPLAVIVLLRPSRARLLVFGVGCVVVPLAFTLAGFSWWDGVVQTHAAWAAGAGSHRPYAYFLAGDLAVLALTIGPAVATALPELLRRAGPLGIIVAAALAGVLALDVSGVTRGEVERIWLPYAAWMTVGAAVYRGTATRRRMLLAQVATALLIQALVKSPW